MNLKQFREKTIGTVVRLLPRPTYKGQSIRSEHNVWLVVEEVQEAVFLLQNRNSRHEVQLGADNIQEFRTPNALILRGQLLLKEEGKTEFEPSAPGLVGDEGLEALIEDTHWGQAKSVYEALKPHEGELVTLRFPDKGDWQFGSAEVVLDKCTPHYVTLRRPEVVIKFPEWSVPKDVSIPRQSVIPAKTTSVPLQYVAIAEDAEHNRPLLVFDHSLWDERR